ncbi:hypothetical protein BB561_004817 [Smittium simulii]|uniref:AMP-dependent synthetase/ligase domain-containing protein n=1 Tax=Smittium simulii TaxID=133385 RepID=A0A2T9YDZ7_9FUNG|nr:hypothetical protein BB561_004817 [Smittium simulii]
MERPIPVWTPKDVEAEEITKFMRYSNSRFGKNMKVYDELLEWSITELEQFWAAVWDYSGIISHTPYTQVLDTTKTMDQIPKWFKGISVNFAENVLEPLKTSSRIAIYARGEQQHRNISFRELYSSVSQAAASLRGLGVMKGDRIVGLITNSPEAIIAFLAASSIGAIWSSASVDFGVAAVSDRFSQVSPKVYISLDEAWYNDKSTSLAHKNSKILENLPSVEHVIIIKNNPNSSALQSPSKSVTTWSKFLENGQSATNILYELVPYEHPLFIVFSSGTTGRPKCIAHSTGGFIVMAQKELKVTSGINHSDILFYFTTTAWIVWNGVVSTLLTGASIVVYEGNPLGPKISKLWDMAEEVGVTRFGTSPRYLQTLEDKNYYPNKHHNLSKIKSIMTTGAPLKPNNYDFVYNNIKSDVFLNSHSGGTEIAASFVGGIPILPVYKGEIQHILPGMAVECWDVDGNKVLGTNGDLVCLKPFPSMPVFFWGDTLEKTRYKSSYFERFPGVWFHGDYMSVNPTTKGISVLGRSDGTLNPNGVRFGSSEIYNIVENFDEVLDSLVVGQQTEQFERVLLFITLKNSQTNVQALKDKINSTIKKSLSPRHVPFDIYVLEKIPYTANMKKVEIAVKLLLNKMYFLAQEFIKASGYSISKQSVIDHVNKTFTLDERTIQSVSDPSAIYQFLNLHDLMFSTNSQSKL